MGNLVKIYKALFLSLNRHFFPDQVTIQVQLKNLKTCLALEDLKRMYFDPQDILVTLKEEFNQMSKIRGGSA